MTEFVKLGLVKAFCLPLLTCCVGALDLTVTCIRELAVCWNDFFRKIFGYKSVKLLQYCCSELPFRYSSRSACIDPDVKRSHGYENRHGRTVASGHGRYCVTLCYLRPLPAWVCMSMRLPMFLVIEVISCRAQTRSSTAVDQSMTDGTGSVRPSSGSSVSGSWASRVPRLVRASRRLWQAIICPLSITLEYRSRVDNRA